jgi:hypothetical protein
MPVVLVFPSCNEPGLEIIESLRQHRSMTVVAASSMPAEQDPSAAMVRRHRWLPMIHSAGFDAALDALIEDESVDMVFATVDSVVERFAARNWQGVTFVGPDAEIAGICGSKTRTLARLQGVVPIPATPKEGSRAFAKPDSGGGSRGVRVVETADEWARARAEGCVVQELLDGDEYTVDCLGAPNGDLLTMSIRRRSVIGRGIALASEFVHDEEIHALVEAVARELRVAGPYFVQFKRDHSGVPKLLEVNARVSGSMGSTRVRGINIPLMAAFAFSGQHVRPPAHNRIHHVKRRLQFSSDLEMPRHVIWDLDDTLVDQRGLPMPMSVAHLLDLNNRGIRQWLMTRNEDPRTLMTEAYIPDVFESVIMTQDKLTALQEFFVGERLSPHEVLMINDSYSERLEHQGHWATLQVLGPEMLDALPWEKQ